MKFNQLISKRIRKLLKERNWTQYKLAQRGGLPQSTLCCILKNRWNTICSETLLNVCRGFDIPITQFFDDPMFEFENIDDNDQEGNYDSRRNTNPSHLTTYLLT